ncbi:MAE_28990/MAE_18760 family HEPN-like nuclease [Aeromonas sanarellii]|uniref:MAE_28990/MAE_18760 family HEPN-like nuclease n=1 Tax=Aeromonas sanarellii TaxID=633415 RepID=UPI0039A0BA66
MFANQRQSSTTRLIEARDLLAEIKRMESPPPQSDPSYVIGMRALLIVNLYACLEFSVNQAVERTLIIIDSLGVPYEHMSYGFHAISMSDAFKSIKDSGVKATWSNRIKFMERLFSSQPCQVNSSTFSNDLQNVWANTIRELFSCFGMTKPFLPDMAYLGHIDDIVNKRNAVAHGRESPQFIGRSLRCSELEQKWDIVSKTCEHITSSFNDYVVSLEFIIPSKRDIYMPKLDALLQ